MRRTLMIKYSDIQDVFKLNGVEAIEYNYETDEDISTPFVVYVASEGSSFGADGVNYINMLNIRLALIDEFFKSETADMIEKTFNDNCITYDKNIEFDNDSRLFTTQYTFDVIDG